MKADKPQVYGTKPEFRKIPIVIVAVVFVAIVCVYFVSKKEKSENQHEGLAQKLPSTKRIENSTFPKTTVVEIMPGTTIASQESPEVQAKPEPIKSPADMLTEIKGEFLLAKLPPEFESVVKRLEELIKIDLSAPQKNEALMLISRCYSKLNNHERAFATFVIYAESSAEKFRTQGQNVVDDALIRILRVEADELYTESEFAMALKYYDLIRTRFPSSTLALSSSENIARHYFNHSEPARAISEFSELIKNHPNSNEARNAYTSLYTLKVNTGDRAGAISLWQDYLKTWPEDKAFVHMNIGTLYFSAREYEKAKEELSIVLTAKNNQNYVVSAKNLLEQIEKLSPEKAK